MVPYYHSVHTVQLYHCTFVIIQNVTILSRSIYDSLLSINTCGLSAFHHFTGAAIKVIYQDSEATPYINSTCHLAINNYRYFCHSKCPGNPMITFSTNQTSFSVYIELVNTNLCRNKIINLVHISVSQCSHSVTVVEISYCICTGELITSSHSTRELFDIEEICNSCPYINEVKSAVHFKGCHFIDIIPIKREIVIIKLTARKCSQPNIPMVIKNCIITNSINVVVIHSTWLRFPFKQVNTHSIFIRNTSFTNLTINTLFAMMTLLNRVLVLEGPIFFRNIISETRLFDTSHTTFWLYNYVEISNCSLTFFIINSGGDVYFALNYSTTLNFTHNNITSFKNPYITFSTQPPCLFQ